MRPCPLRATQKPAERVESWVVWRRRRSADSSEACRFGLAVRPSRQERILAQGGERLVIALEGGLHVVLRIGPQHCFQRSVSEEAPGRLVVLGMRLQIDL